MASCVYVRLLCAHLGSSRRLSLCSRRHWKAPTVPSFFPALSTARLHFKPRLWVWNNISNFCILIYISVNTGKYVAGFLRQYLRQRYQNERCWSLQSCPWRSGTLASLHCTVLSSEGKEKESPQEGKDVRQLQLPLINHKDHVERYYVVLFFQIIDSHTNVCLIHPWELC